MAIDTPAHTAPVDAHVRQAIADIEAAETTLTSGDAGSAGNIRRAARRLEGAAAELERSPNKRHPSWVNANERVDSLMVSLARWKEAAGATRH